MAQITITTTERQDFGATRETEVYNAASGENLTPVQYVRQRLFHQLDAWATKYEAADQVTKVELYQRASAADKAAVDAILDQYR